MTGAYSWIWDAGYKAGMLLQCTTFFLKKCHWNNTLTLCPWNIIWLKLPVSQFSNERQHKVQLLELEQPRDQVINLCSLNTLELDKLHSDFCAKLICKSYSISNGYELRISDHKKITIGLTFCKNYCSHPKQTYSIHQGLSEDTTQKQKILASCCKCHALSLFSIQQCWDNCLESFPEL